MVIALVGEESCLIACFFECCNDTFLLINGIEVMCRNRRHQHRYTFMCSIGFGQDVAESC